MPMTNSAISHVSDYFIQVLTFNDFKTLFLMIVAVFIVKPLSDPAYNLAPMIVSKVKNVLKLENDETLSNRCILSALYCLLFFFALLLVHFKFPEFPAHQKVISAFMWPIFAYVLLTILGILLTTFFMLPVDLLRIAIAVWMRFSQKKANQMVGMKQGNDEHDQKNESGKID